MKVFLSWSGEQSKAVAQALRNWLPEVLQNLQPWMSQKDLGAGVRWSQEIESQLKSSSFGIICVTTENRNAPWLNFEAGAISNSLEGSRVVPYIFGMGFADMDGPLTQFQGKQSDEVGTFELVQSLNSAAGDKGISAERLKNSFERTWPDLESKLSGISLSRSVVLETESRSQEDKIDELISMMRSIMSKNDTDSSDNMRRNLNEQIDNLMIMYPEIIDYRVNIRTKTVVLMSPDGVRNFDKSQRNSIETKFQKIGFAVHITDKPFNSKKR